MAATYLKDPAEDLIITIDFSAELGVDTIASVAWATDLTEDATSNTTTAASITVSAGTDGVAYDVRATATTTAGNTFVKAVSVLVADEQAKASDGLTTVRRVATQLGITDEAELYLISEFINEASAAIEAYCNRKFKQDSVVEKVSGNGNNFMFLSRLPVASITSITHDGATVSSSDYEIANSKSGEIYNKYGWIDTVGRNSAASLPERPYSERKLYEVTYVGGYKLPSDPDRDLPYDVERACIETVAGMYLTKADNPNISKQSLAGVVSIEYNNKDAGGLGVNLPSTARAALDKHKVVL